MDVVIATACKDISPHVYVHTKRTHMIHTRAHTHNRMCICILLQNFPRAISRRHRLTTITKTRHFYSYLYTLYISYSYLFVFLKLLMLLLLLLAILCHPKLTPRQFFLVLLLLLQTSLSSSSSSVHPRTHIPLSCCCQQKTPSFLSQFSLTHSKILLISSSAS